MNTELPEMAHDRCVAQICEALFGQPGMTLTELANCLRLASGRNAPLLCATCYGVGMIGGPSFYEPGEGGVSCPDCVQPSPDGQGDAVVELADADVLDIVARYVGRTSSTFRYIKEDLTTRLAAAIDDALTATGKQQVGENSAWRDELVREAYTRGLVEGLNSRQPQQVGEVQADARAQFEAWAKDAELDASRSIFNPDRYKQEPARFAWYAWQAALAARQPVGHFSEVRAAACDFYNATVGDQTVRISCPSSDQRDSVTAIGERLRTALAAMPSQPVGEPVPMVLHCPRCHVQHIDAPDERTPDWQNPPHRSHLCHGCGLIWRPADVPTIGVEHTQTAGRGDSHFSPDPTGVQAPIGFANPHHLNDTSTDGVILRKKGEFFTVPVYAAPPAQSVDLGQFRVAVYCMQNYTGVLPRKYWDKGSKAFDAEATRLMTVIDGAEVARG